MSAYAQCSIDSAAQVRPGISPAPENIPCIERTTVYNQTLQVMCPFYYDSVVNIPVVNTTYPVEVTIDSMELTAVNGLPPGITWTKNPMRLKGGENGCITFSGTTTAAPGPYEVEWYGTVWGSLPSQVPAQLRYPVYTGGLTKYNYVKYYFNVIEPGDTCIHYKNHPAGISDASEDLARSLRLYPNPAAGSFELSVYTAAPTEGEIEVSDVTGRVVYATTFSASGSYKTRIDLTGYGKGFYIVRLHTAEGTAARTITIE